MFCTQRWSFIPNAKLLCHKKASQKLGVGLERSVLGAKRVLNTACAFQLNCGIWNYSLNAKLLRKGPLVFSFYQIFWIFFQVQHGSIASYVALFIVLTAILATASFVTVQRPTLVRKTLPTTIPHTTYHNTTLNREGFLNCSAGSGAFSDWGCLLFQGVLRLGPYQDGSAWEM